MIIPTDIWEEFKKHRKVLKKPMTAYAESLILKKLAKWQAQGHDVIEIINTSIENGWQGVFLPQQQTMKAQWWQTNSGIESKARELGLAIRPGETWVDLKGRIQAKVGH